MNDIICINTYINAFVITNKVISNEGTFQYASSFVVSYVRCSFSFMNISQQLIGIGKFGLRNASEDSKYKRYL